MQCFTVIYDFILYDTEKKVENNFLSSFSSYHVGEIG